MKIKNLIAFTLILSSYSAYSIQLGFLKKPRRPPPEAVFACEDATADDECSFEINDTLLRGNCYTPDENFPLACRPNKEGMRILSGEDN
jgi:hypothetical protein